MTASSTASPPFEHHPGMRPISGAWRKTVLCVRGGGGIGKSSLCSLLRGAGIGYVSVDSAVVECPPGIPEIDAHREAHGEAARYRLHLLYPILARNGEFLTWFCDRYIEGYRNLNIMIDGWLFSHPECYAALEARCRERGWRLWTVERRT